MFTRVGKVLVAALGTVKNPTILAQYPDDLARFKLR
jgi:hypothetical protein